MIRLVEYQKGRLIDNTKKKHKDRFARRTEISDNEVSLSRVGLLELKSGKRDLQLAFKVRDYTVTIVILKYMDIYDRFMNSRKFKNKNPRPIIIKSLQYSLKYNHLLVDCTCPDFRYRLAYKASKKGYKAGDVEDRPSNITNPKLDGGLCKHLSKVLNTTSKWIPLVATGIYDYYKNTLDDSEEV